MLTAHKTLHIADMDFRLIPLHEATFHDHDVIYIILDAQQDGTFKIIDAGDSPEYGSPPINSPQRILCWRRHGTDLWVGIYPLPCDYNMHEDRIKIIADLRLLHKIPCGPA